MLKSAIAMSLEQEDEEEKPFSMKGELQRNAIKK